MKLSNKNTVQMKNTVFLFESFTYYIFFVSSLHLNDFHLRTRRCQSSVLGKCRSIPLPFLFDSSFSKLSIASHTSQLILQPFFRFSYVTGVSLTSPGEPPMQWNTFSVKLLRFELYPPLLQSPRTIFFAD